MAMKEKMNPGVNCFPEMANGPDEVASVLLEVAPDPTTTLSLSGEEIAQLQADLRQLRSDLSVARFTIEQLEAENKALR